MVQRYVHIKTRQGATHYGILHLNRHVQLLTAPAWLGGQTETTEFEPEGYELLAPCSPSKVIAVGRNYPLHAQEIDTIVPKEPLLFLKPPTTIIANGAAIHYPNLSQRIDYEGELALIIGDHTRHCPVEAAMDKIWGYTIANDVTARDLQRQDNQWTRAKGFDSFCPLGPWIVRELSASAQLQTFLNDEPEPKQSTLIEAMVFSPADLVSYISQIMTLIPGDVILTGTPAGVGKLQVGDRIRVEIEGIGSLENSVVADPTPPIPLSNEPTGQALPTS